MTKVKNLIIQNYKSCVSTKIDINEGVTALIGVNGVGKSNILNSLRLLRKINSSRYLRHPVARENLSHSGIKFDLEMEKRTFNFKSDIYFETDERNIDEIYSNIMWVKESSSKKWLQVDIHMYENYFRFKDLNIDKRSIYARHFGGRKKFNQSHFELFSKLIKYLSEISYYSATQFSNPSLCSVSIELDESRPIFKFGSDKSHDRFIHDLFSTWKSDKKEFEKYIETVNRNGIGLIDRIDFIEQKLPSSSYEIKTGGKIRKVEKSKHIVIPSITLDGLTLSPNQLSEGTFKTLALIFYILTDNSELMLIEEPEVCVHHGLLSSIIELIKIKSKEKQIIISTHSDFVLDKLRPENILLVKRTATKGTSVKSLTSSLTKNEYSALRDYLNNSGNLGEYWKEGGFENGKD